MIKRTTSVFPEIILCITLAGTALGDLKWRRVPNIWLLPGLFAGLCLRGIRFFWPAILMFFPVYLLFRIKVMGAGDGKVLMLIAGSLNFHDAALSVFSGFLIAAVIAVSHIIYRKSCRGRLRRLALAAAEFFSTGSTSGSAWESLRAPENSIPLAACLAAGTIPVILIRTFIL